MSSPRAGNHDKALYELSQKHYVVTLLPYRAEPQGYVSLKPHSCGLPCLIPTHASVAPLISRLVTEPDYFIGMPPAKNCSVRLNPLLLLNFLGLFVCLYARLLFLCGSAVQQVEHDPDRFL